MRYRRLVLAGALTSRTVFKLIEDVTRVKVDATGRRL
jgi:hypothetical protein